MNRRALFLVIAATLITGAIAVAQHAPAPEAETDPAVLQKLQWFQEIQNS